MPALTFRQEVAPHLFRALRGGWSCAVVGLAGAGLSNLLRFIAEPQVAGHYLGEEAAQSALIYVEADALGEPAGLAQPAVLPAALAREAVAAARRFDWPRADVAALRRLCDAPDPAEGLRALLDFACGQQGRRVVFVLDAADSLLRHAPAGELRRLRAMRDDHKQRLAFVLGLRREPDVLRAERETAAGGAASAVVAKFTELFDDHTYPLRPYSRDDALLAIARKTAGWEACPSSEQQDRLYRASGGHARLLMAALVQLEARLHLPWPSVERDLAAAPNVLAASRALWDDLDAGERWALWHLAADQRDAIPPGELDRLVLRGLATGGPPFVFASLFETFLVAQPRPPAPPEPARLSRLRDPAARVTW